MWIVADGIKLPPVLVFKGNQNGRVTKELEKYPFVESKQLFAFWQKKAWNNKDVMRKWINVVFRKYVQFKLKKKNMLVLDEASVHRIPEIKKSLELSETKVMMIPGGLARYLQSLDVSINKPFKDRIRKKYNEYWLGKGNIKVLRKEIFNWVGEVWYDDNLTSYMIEKSFKKAGITLNFTGVKMICLLLIMMKKKLKKNVAEADQMVAEADNEEKVDESIDDISSVAFTESDDEEEKKKKIL